MTSHENITLRLLATCLDKLLQVPGVAEWNADSDLIAEAEALVAEVARPAAPQCIITGCSLMIPDAHQCWSGDLHRLGDVYIFNANPNSCRGIGDDKPFYTKQLTVRPGAHYYEKRAVFVIPLAAAVLNAEAAQHIAS